MPLQQNVKNVFKCDLKKPDGTPDCNIEFEYDPGRQGQPPPQWDEGTRAALTRIVAITHSLTGFVTFFCSDAHAIEGINRAQHLPPVPSQLTVATSDAEVKAAAAGAKAVAQMKKK